MKVYITQEISEDEVHNAKVYLDPATAARYAADIVEYVSLTTEDGKKVNLKKLEKWTGKEIDFYDGEGAVCLRLYSTETEGTLDDLDDPKFNVFHAAKTSLEDYQSQTGERIRKHLVRDVIQHCAKMHEANFDKATEKRLVDDLWAVMK